MNTQQLYTTALQGLKTNRVRSSLTMLGIIIGVASIIIIVSLGQGVQNFIINEVEGLGATTIAVIPGREPSGPSDFAHTFADSLKIRDFEALRRKENVPYLKNIMPVVFGSENASFMGETHMLTVFGGTPLVKELFNITVLRGRFFDEQEVKSRARVVILGSKAKEELFGDSDALGKKIRIKEKSLTVIGILPTTGQVSFFNFDDMAIVPYSTVQHVILGIKHFNRFIIEVQSEEVLKETVGDIARTLRESHGITDPEKDDFFISTQEDLAESLGAITTTLTLLLVSIAAISLIVGGVGIMNIMLVSVSERTREIGLRKAVGATNRDIMKQFLLEAIMLTGIGGIIGICLGLSFSFLAISAVRYFVTTNIYFSFPWMAIFLGLGVSGGVGIVFGLYPARQASKKSPTEALRYE